MRHYEVMILIHPDQSEQVSSMVDRYKGQIEQSGGAIHRLEDLGRRLLAYPINKIHKAHYVLLNIECAQEALDELNTAFKFNDAIIRYNVERLKEAVTEESPLMKQTKEQKNNARRMANEVRSESEGDDLEEVEAVEDADGYDEAEAGEEG